MKFLSNKNMKKLSIQVVSATSLSDLSSVLCDRKGVFPDGQQACISDHRAVRQSLLSTL